MTVLSRKTPIARKSYLCDACEAFRRAGIGDDELSKDDLLIVQGARADKWRILAHRQYVKHTYKDGGDLMTYRARIDMDALANRLELFSDA